MAEFQPSMRARLDHLSKNRHSTAWDGMMCDGRSGSDAMVFNAATIGHADRAHPAAIAPPAHAKPASEAAHRWTGRNAHAITEALWTI